MTEHQRLYYKYKALKYQNILKNYQKGIDKSNEMCYNKDTK